MSAKVKPSYKQTEVGVIPEDWSLMDLSSISAFITKGATPTTYGFKWESSGVLFLRSECVSERGLDLSQSMFISNAAHVVLRRSEIQDGDLLVTITGYVGRVIRYNNTTAANINQHIARIRISSPNMSSDYVYHFLSLPFCRNRFNAITTGQAYPQISLTQVRNAIIPIPPTLAEQQAIAEALTDADALIESLEQLIAKKRLVKQGAMQELLTGKRRLPGFSGEWEEKRLGDTATLKARIGWQGLTTAEYLDSGDYFLVTGTDFKYGYIDWSNCNYVAKSRYDQDKYIQLKEHDVLVTKDGTIGKVAIISSLQKPATLNSGVFVIRPVESAFQPEFFYYILCSTAFFEFLNQLSAGSTINHLYQKDFVSFRYKVPPTIKEQSAIANIIGDMDAEIAVLGEKLAKARQVKQGMMQELLTGRIRLVETANDTESKVDEHDQTQKKSHNWAFNEAVVISILTERFATRKYPLGRKRYTKLSYLMHRHVEHKAEGYSKKAAGPYNPDTKYRGPEKIAKERQYIQSHSRDKYQGFIASSNIGEAMSYFTRWYGPDILTWLDQFRFISNEKLELLTTVDMAACELHDQGKEVNVNSVRDLIADAPEWLPKLDRSVFSDENIQAALDECHVLFLGEWK